MSLISYKNDYHHAGPADWLQGNTLINIATCFSLRDVRLELIYFMALDHNCYRRNYDYSQTWRCRVYSHQRIPISLNSDKDSCLFEFAFRRPPLPEIGK